jgi:hypothetical protein
VPQVRGNSKKNGAAISVFFSGEISQRELFFSKNDQKKRKFCDLRKLLPFFEIKLIKLTTYGRPRHFLGHHL